MPPRRRGPAVAGGLSGRGFCPGPRGARCRSGSPAGRPGGRSGGRTAEPSPPNRSGARTGGSPVAPSDSGGPEVAVGIGGAWVPLDRSAERPRIRVGPLRRGVRPPRSADRTGRHRAPPGRASSTATFPAGDAPSRGTSPPWPASAGCPGAKPWRAGSRTASCRARAAASRCPPSGPTTSRRAMPIAPSSMPTRRGRPPAGWARRDSPRGAKSRTVCGSGATHGRARLWPTLRERQVCRRPQDAVCIF